MENNNKMKQERLKKEELFFEILDYELMDRFLSENIESFLIDLNKLDIDKKIIANPNALGKEIYESIFNQLGAQNELDTSGELLRSQYNHSHEGETKQSALTDAIRSRDYQEVRKKNTEASKTKEGVMDAYTGKKIKVNDGHQVNTDHVISRSEIYGKGFKKRLREFSGNSVSELANAEENLVATTESANKSKKDKNATEYIKEHGERKKDLTNQNEKKINKILSDESLTKEQKDDLIKKQKIRYQDKMDIDTAKMSELDTKARRNQNKKIVKDSTKRLGKEAGTAAFRAMIMGSITTLVKNIIDNLVDFFKSSKKSFNHFQEKIKNAISSFFKSLAGILKTSASAASSSIMNNLMSLLMEPVQKLWSSMKIMLSTLKKAIETFLSPEHKDEDLSIRIANVGKVITAGLVVSGVMVLSAAITQLLETAFPVLKGFTIPIIGSLTGLIVEVMLAVLGGILTGVIINQLNMFIKQKQTNKINTEISEKQNRILESQKIQMAMVKKQGNHIKRNTVEMMNIRHSEANEATKGMLEDIFLPVNEEELFLEKMQTDLDLLL